MYNTYGSEVGGSDIYVPGGGAYDGCREQRGPAKMEREERHRGQLRVTCRADVFNCDNTQSNIHEMSKPLSCPPAITEPADLSEEKTIRTLPR